MNDELPEIQADLKDHRSQLFMCILYYTAGNWDLEEVYEAMEWINDWEKGDKPKLKAIK